jgi:HEAT repeat protein
VPGRGAGTGSGASTKKARSGSRSLINWEHWWARNKFRYLEFPGIADKEGMRPRTPRSERIQDRIDGLKKDCIALFRPFLFDRSARLRRAALIGLARLGDAESLPAMMGLLQDGNQTVRDAALLALGILGSDEANHTLLHIVRGTEQAAALLGQSNVPDYFRAFAQVSLALEKVKGIDLVLEGVARDRAASPEVRALALEGLGLLGGDGAIKFLMEFAGDSRGAPELLSAAVAALGKSGESIAMSCLDQCLFSRSVPMRQSAALGLGSLAGARRDDIVKRLHRGYRHTNDQALKGFSLIAMGRIGGAQAVQFLDRAARTGPSSDHAWACLGLGLALRKAPDERAADHLVQQAVSHPNRSTRGAAAIALGLVRCGKAVESLTRMLAEGDDPYHRGYCALALGMIGDASSVAPLRLAMRKDALPQVRTQAALALALLRDTAFSGELLDLLVSSHNDATKAFVALSLGFMGDVRIVEDVHAMLGERDLDDLTQLHCIHLVSKLLSGKAVPYLEPVAAGSNFATEYPLVRYLLEFDV